jgi:hypothetical protein
MKSIAQEIEELREMKMPDLLEKYSEVFGKEPRVKHREHLWKRIAWKIQEQRFGGLTRVAQRRLEELIAEIDLPLDEQQRTVTGGLRGGRKPNSPAVGTVLTRQWKGEEIRVNVVENGFEWNRVVYRSLTAVAKAITGSHWNGKLFFGITKRKKAK